MRIYVKNVPAKFHADLIGNDRALSFSVAEILGLSPYISVN